MANSGSVFFKNKKKDDEKINISVFVQLHSVLAVNQVYSFMHLAPGCRKHQSQAEAELKSEKH